MIFNNSHQSRIAFLQQEVNRLKTEEILTNLSADVDAAFAKASAAMKKEFEEAKLIPPTPQKKVRKPRKR